MGLDIVEIIMEMEERFDIEIPDEVLGEVRTVRDLKDLVLQLVFLKVGDAHGDACPSGSTFRALRRELIGMGSSHPRRDFQLDAKVESLLPEGNLRDQWSDLASRTGLRLPMLRMRALPTLVTMAVSAVICFGLMFRLLPNSVNPIAIGAVLSLVAAFGTLIVLAKHSIFPMVPAHCATMRGLVKETVYHNPHLIADQMRTKPTQTKSEIEAGVVDVIATMTGVKESEVTDEAELIKDLSLG